MILEVVAAEYALGMLDSYDLPQLALEAVAAGIDSPNLAALAGAERSASPAELRDLFERGIREVGVVVSDRRTASTLLKRHYARQIAEGALPPRQGAGRIKELLDCVYDIYPNRKIVGDTLGVTEIIGLYYQVDEVDENDDDALSQIDAALVTASNKILAEQESV